MLNSTNSPSLAQSSANADLIQLDLASFSQLLKACGDPLRIQILQVLKTDTFGVLELTQIFDTKQSGMSHHLKVLSKSGLVEAQREGNAIFYRRPFSNGSAHDTQAIDQLFSLIDRFPMSDELATSIAVIREQRAELSQAFFEKHADRFKEQQELICDYEQYAPATLELLTKSGLGSDATVLELGPGEGQFLKPLSQSYEKVIALDNSEQMLNAAKQFAAREALANIEFFLGDTSSYEGPAVDAIVMNMVLHHTPSPAGIFADCAGMLKPEGVLVICDLSHHNQDWAKANCGDLWLGFEPNELSNWAERSGLKESESVFIGLRNGFQIQLHRFIKLSTPPQKSS